MSALSQICSLVYCITICWAWHVLYFYTCILFLNLYYMCKLLVTVFLLLYSQWSCCFLIYQSFSFLQFSLVAQSCLTICDPMNCSTPGLPVHQQHPEFTQTLVHWVGDAIQSSHPLLSPSHPTFNVSQYQGLFQWVSSLHQVAKVLEFQLQQSF